MKLIGKIQYTNHNPTNQPIFQLDDIPVGILFASLAVLICLSAFFSASETATMALNRYRLADQASKKNRRAMMLQKLLDEPDRLLGTILLGNNLVNNAAVAITTMLAWKFYGEAGVAVATACITIVILVLAEIPPKTMAALYPERIAYFAAFLLNLLQRLLFPVVWLMSLVVKLIRKVPQFNQRSSSNSLDSDELRHAVKASEQHFKQDHIELLLGILELGSQSVESIMVPRAEIHAIDLNDELVDIIEQILKEPHARLPVYEKSFEQIKGELDIRELLQKYRIDEITKDIILETLKEPIYLPEDTRLVEQIQRLQTAERNMGIVIDEYGEVMGLFTLHELLSQFAGVIGGPIKDKIPGIVSEEQGSYLVSAALSVRDLNRLMKWNLPTEGPNTLNGLIIETYEDIPQPGMTFKFNGHRVETVRVRGTAVDVARVFPAEVAEPADDHLDATNGSDNVENMP